ncbi:MAG: cysteine hydrolase [Nocardioides sp.]|uniref:cysteine hydrolase n=1 Tax=Nocardioides sp. TaxID=35761 RepID=UPI0039E489B9
MPIDPKTTAVVLIEYQNDFTSEGGVLHDAVSEAMDSTKMLSKTKDVVDAARAEGDIVIECKRGLDTFASTNLDFMLRSKGIKTLVLGGFLTNCCVESTMRSGYENGYQVIALSDCVAATSPDEHENALKYDYPMFSTPMPAVEFIDQLEG